MTLTSSLSSFVAGKHGHQSMSAWSTTTSKGVTSLCYQGEIQLNHKGCDGKRTLEAQAAFLNERGLAPSLATCLADGGKASRIENEAMTLDLFPNHKFTPKHKRWELNMEVEI